MKRVGLRYLKLGLIVREISGMPLRLRNEAPERKHKLALRKRHVVGNELGSIKRAWRSA